MISRILSNIRTDIKISRPGLWFPTIWIYMVPFNLEGKFWLSYVFWIGLFFVTFPLNYLVYGLNDYNDIEADSINERKGNFLFGARASREFLKRIPIKIAFVVLPFMVYFISHSGFQMFVVMLVMVFFNVIYNFKPFRLKERPPFEIFIQAGYVITVLFSVLLNGLPIIPWQTIVYLSLFAFQAHIAGEIMDIKPDRKAGKKTTATIIGRKNTKLLMLFILSGEVVLLIKWFHDYVLASFLGIFSLWMLMDVFIFFKDKPYSLKQMKLFGMAINISALASMLWILYTGNLIAF